MGKSNRFLASPPRTQAFAATPVPPVAPKPKPDWLVDQSELDKLEGSGGLIDLAAENFPAARLVKSPYNVRTNAEDSEATTALEASILRRGILQPLTGHPLRTTDQIGIVAGGRRLRAVKQLIERGDLPADFPVPVRVLDVPAHELLEISTAENLLRRDLRDYETYVAIRRMHEAGADVASIAADLGQQVVFVQRWLRLARLAPDVFDAYAEGRLSLDQARAYAATEDEALQLAAFEQLRRKPDYDHRPAHIRAALGVADARLGRLLRYVGEEVYRATGGRFELDLFADEAEVRGRVVDAPVLTKLAEAKMARLREETRATFNVPDLRFIGEPPKEGAYPDYTLQIAKRDEQQVLLARPEAIVGCIQIGEDGAADLTFWWESRKAKTAKAATGASQPSQSSPYVKPREGTAIDASYGYAAAQSANGLIRENEGLSSTGVEVMRGIRRMVLRAMLVDRARQALQAEIAADYLAWSQLRMMLGDRLSSSDTGMAKIALTYTQGPAATADVVRAHVDATPAHAFWESARHDLSLADFMTERTPVDGFRAYRSAPRAMKELATAFVAGLALERSLDADGYRCPLHDALALELHGGDANATDAAVRYWAPPTEAMLGLLPSKDLLALTEPWVDRSRAAKWRALKRPQLVRAVHLLVTKGIDARNAATRVQAMDWFHSLLAFARAGRAL